MQTERVVLIISLAINLITLILFLSQTRYLSKSLKYSSYQKLIDYTNEVSKLLIENPSVIEIFKDVEFIKAGLNQSQGMSVEQIGLAWLIINRYEAAFVGYELGVIPDVEWKVWKKRLEKDLKIPFIRNVWRNDVGNFEYNKKFKDLIEDLL